MEMSNIFLNDVKADKVYVNVDKLECFIPKRYAANNRLILGDKIDVLGIFNMIVNGTEKRGLCIPAMIACSPSDMYNGTSDGESCTVLSFKKGDVFSHSRMLLQDSFIGFFMWNEFIALGHLPSSITYNDVIGLFDNMRKFTGKGIPVNHAVLEMIYAHLYRNPENMTEAYRLTDRTVPPKMINLHDVSYGATTTHSRIFGSYATAGINSALVNTQTKNNELEDVFRQ